MKRYDTTNAPETHVLMVAEADRLTPIWGRVELLRAIRGDGSRPPYILTQADLAALTKTDR